MENNDILEQSEKMQAINKLLSDYSKAQSSVIRELRNAIITISVVAFTVILLVVGGFLWYESQYEHSTTTITQEAELESGDAVINNGGAINAEQGKTNGSN